MSTTTLKSRGKNMLSSLLSLFISPLEKINVVRISAQQEIKRLEQLNKTLFDVGYQLNRDLSFEDNQIFNEKARTIHRYIWGVHTLLKEIIDFKKGVYSTTSELQQDIKAR